MCNNKEQNQINEITLMIKTKTKITNFSFDFLLCESFFDALHCLDVTIV